MKQLIVIDQLWHLVRVESLVFTVCSNDKRGEVDWCKLPYIPQKAINCMLVTHAKYKCPAIVLAISLLSHVQKANMCNHQTRPIKACVVYS
jgi:hypothetical protein